MAMKAPPEAPEGERLAGLEGATGSLAREIRGLKADMRDLRTTMRRNFLILIGVLVATWLVTISLLIATMFRT